jgi:hypothetical protein
LRQLTGLDEGDGGRVQRGGPRVRGSAHTSGGPAPSLAEIASSPIAGAGVSWFRPGARTPATCSCGFLAASSCTSSFAFAAVADPARRAMIAGAGRRRGDGQGVLGAVFRSAARGSPSRRLAVGLHAAGFLVLSIGVDALLMIVSIAARPAHRSLRLRRDAGQPGRGGPGNAGYREQRGDLRNRDFALVLCG